MLPGNMGPGVGLVILTQLDLMRLLSFLSCTGKEQSQGSGRNDDGRDIGRGSRQIESDFSLQDKGCYNGGHKETRPQSVAHDHGKRYHVDQGQGILKGSRQGQHQGHASTYIDVGPGFAKMNGGVV